MIRIARCKQVSDVVTLKTSIDERAIATPAQNDQRAEQKQKENDGRIHQFFRT